jgi:hypothetical protein
MTLESRPVKRHRVITRALPAIAALAYCARQAAPIWLVRVSAMEAYMTMEHQLVLLVIIHALPVVQQVRHV